MISYAGVPLTEPSPALRAWAEAAVRPAELYEFAARAWPGAERLNWPDFPGWHPPVRLGHLFWPAGASRWAVGHFVASSAQLAAVKAAAVSGTYGDFRAADLVLDDGANSLTTSLWLLPPRPLAQTPGGPDGYLLTLVDERFFWWTLQKAFAVLEGTTTWADVFALPGAAWAAPWTTAVTADAVPSAYLAPSGEFGLYYLALPRLLDAAALSAGLRVARRLDGAVLAQSYTAAAASAAAQLGLGWPRRAGGAFDAADLTRAAPAAVAVLFRKSNGGVIAPGGHYASEVALADLAPAEYTPRRGLAQTKATFYDTAIANYAVGAAVPDNQAELDALAARFAADWYRWRLGALDVSFRGLRAWAADGLHDVEWVHGPGEAYTLVRRGPWNDAADRLLHAGGAPREDRVATGGCDSCAWLGDVPESGCVRIRVLGGSGRCACVDATQDFNAVWMDSFDGWVGYRMVKACCGCGVALFQITDPDALTATLTYSGLHIACGAASSGGAGIVSVALTKVCCGRNKVTGNPTVVFAGKGASLCSGSRGSCDNTFLVVVECGAACPPVDCGCEHCGEYPAPPSWVSNAQITGFTDDNYNGYWVWSGSGCTWTATCGGASSTLEFVAGLTPDLDVWRLTHGGKTFELSANYTGTNSPCQETMTLTNTAPGAGAPDTIVVRAMHAPNLRTSAGGQHDCCGAHGRAYCPPGTGILGTASNQTGEASCIEAHPTYSSGAPGVHTWSSSVCEGGVSFILRCVNGCARFYTLAEGGSEVEVLPTSYAEYPGPFVAVYDLTFGPGSLQTGGGGGTCRFTITDDATP
jgi:hypothetical protein